MSDKKASAEEKIIQATIDCIEEEGLERTTTRKIAERAGVNNASLNYYFRTKANLVEKAIDTTLKNAFDWDDFSESEHAGPADRLSHILEHLAKGAMDYPGLARAHFTAVIKGNYEGPVTEAFNRFLKELEADLASREVNLDRENLQLAIAQAVAAMFLPAVFAPLLFEQYADIDFRDAEVRHRYINRLSHALLSAAEDDDAPTRKTPESPNR